MVTWMATAPSSDLHVKSEDHAVRGAIHFQVSDGVYTP